MKRSTKAHNPYTLVFGKEPVNSISRAAQKMEILEAFTAPEPSQQVYMITGVRGSGKTVFMTEISKELAADKGWVVIELNPSQDLLSSLASALCSDNVLAGFFQQAGINLSFWGIGLEVKSSVPITNEQVAVTRMLESLKKHNKKLLICIDEVVPSEYMKIFAGAFQILVRQDLPVYLLMTGLYSNIDSLQNDKGLTFLYRAPKISLKPLNISTIADNYGKDFELEREDALNMARMTKGYSFAFQVLGYFTWKNSGDYMNSLGDFRQYLEDYVYDNLWSEMSGKDRQIAYAVAKSTSGKTSEIMGLAGTTNSEFSPYRKRLIKSGLLDGNEYGRLRFTLPLFEEFVIVNYESEL